MPVVFRRILFPVELEEGDPLILMIARKIERMRRDVDHIAAVVGRPHLNRNGGKMVVAADLGNGCGALRL